MFSTLLESKATRSSQYRYIIASIAAHSTLIAGAAVATAKTVDGDGPDSPIPESVIYVTTPTPVETPASTVGDPRPASERWTESIWKDVAARVPTIDLSGIPRTLPPTDATIGDFLRRVHEDLGGAPGAAQPGGAGSGGAIPEDGAYTVAAVERVAALRTVIEPPYPAGLRAAGVTGRVVLRLVVDSTGRVDPARIVVQESANDQFTAAVRSILPRLRFTPAMLRGRPVAQLVELPFEFTLRR